MESKEFADIKQMHLTAFDEVMKEKLVPIIGQEVAASVQKTVATLKLQRQDYGHDMTRLDESQKKLFVDTVRASVGFGIREKANEALIGEQDNRGGHLVSREIADAIVRIAASVGTIMSQAAKWKMTTDELAVPNYTGAFLTGAYLGVDAPGTVTGIAFGQAQLIAKKWQLAFVVGNDLLADANVDVADWLLALGGESLANMIDYQGFVGGANGASGGDPFLGILNLPTSTTIQPNDTNVNKVYLGGSSTSGNTAFKNYALMDDSSALIGTLEESILDGAAFYMNRTLWAKIRIAKDTAGNYILPYAGLARPEPAVENFPGGGPIKPAGELLGYPVYTNRWMPAVGASSVNGFSDAASNPCVIFGNMGAFAFGDKGEMQVAQFESGSFGGKEIALADQRGIVYKHRHALTLTLPRAMAVAYTSAS